MPKKPGRPPKTKEEPTVQVPSKEDNKEKAVELLMSKIPGLFDRYPQGSLSRDGVRKLLDELNAL